MIVYVQRILTIAFILIGCVFVSALGKGFDANGEKDDGKLRICLVEARGTYRKATKNCPILESKSNIKCVIGMDRLDCMRRISKGTAHFGVFSPEELLAAKWSGADVLITSEMRFNDDPFQYEIVAVVANDANINSVNDLRGSRLCHPGYGLSRHWTDIMANYLESTMIARECEDDLSPLESRIKASAKFFGPSCKPGPWTIDPSQDTFLKKRYPSLCEACYSPSTCSKTDKYWGRMGPLYCLTSGDGEIAWVRLDDVRTHFGFTGLQAEADANLYSYLCLDGHLQPLTTETPCVWAAQPWAAIAAKREYASTVQVLLEHLDYNNESSWQSALLNILETYHVNIKQLDNTIPIDDYLGQAIGFSSAYSFPACNPPRAIVYCTTSLVEHIKCSWLQEVASVHGIEPNLQCVREMSLDNCMGNVQHGVADVVFVDESERVRAELGYQLRPHLFEYAKNKRDRYTVVAVVKTDSDIYNFNDLYMKRACFPSYVGVAYLSVLQTIRHMRGGSIDNEVESYFSKDSCTWAPHSSHCKSEYSGDDGALLALKDNRCDVAFVDMAIFEQYIGMTTMTTAAAAAAAPPSAHSIGMKPSINLNSTEYKLICPFGRERRPDELCYLHWASRGYIMINNHTNVLRKNEIYNTLRDMDRLFGKYYESHVLSFSMFAPFDRKTDVMYHDRTEALRGFVEMEKDRTPRYLESTFRDYIKYEQYRLNDIRSLATIRQLDVMLAFIVIFMVVHHSYRNLEYLL